MAGDVFKLRWVVKPRLVLEEAYGDIKRDMIIQVNGISEVTAAEIEAWMKENAVWTDRTGEARATLYAEVKTLGHGAFIEIGHGVPYGFWLEVARSGAYSILRPALDRFAPVLFSRIRTMMTNPRSGESYRYNISGGRIRKLR